AAAKAAGKAIAERGKAAGITAVAFDRGGRMYHGRVKALAEVVAAVVVDAAASAAEAGAVAAVIAIAAAKARKAASNHPSFASIAAPKSSKAAELSASARWSSPAIAAAASASATARPTKFPHRSKKPPRTPARRCSRSISKAPPSPIRSRAPAAPAK